MGRAPHPCEHRRARSSAQRLAHPVHSESRAELVGYLSALRERGNDLSMLFMTVRTTNHGMIAGVVPGSLVLDLVHGPSRSLVASLRFSLFCRGRGLRSSWEAWGSEKVSRGFLGLDVASAADTIDACFERMFGDSGPYAVDFRAFGWKPADTSLEQ